MVDIKYGKLEGPCFSQTAIDNVLLPLAEDIGNVVPEACDWEVWYDAREDFHHLKFTANDDIFDIRYYRVLSYFVNGEVYWTGCPTHNTRDFVESIRKRVQD